MQLDLSPSNILLVRNLSCIGEIAGLCLPMEKLDFGLTMNNRCSRSISCITFLSVS